MSGDMEPWNCESICDKPRFLLKNFLHPWLGTCSCNHVHWQPHLAATNLLLVLGINAPLQIPLALKGFWKLLQGDILGTGFLRSSTFWLGLFMCWLRLLLSLKKCPHVSDRYILLAVCLDHMCGFSWYERWVLLLWLSACCRSCSYLDPLAGF